MCRRLSNRVCVWSMAAALGLLAATAGAPSAQASCGDYLAGAQSSGDVHGAPLTPVPAHEHGCRHGSCRPSLPAPVSETSAWNLLKHTACVAEGELADVRSQRHDASAESPTALGPDRARLFRPPRAA
jgi:hypothetical protein